MKYLIILLLCTTAHAEKLMLNENYELVPYQDYSQRADIDREQRADVRGSLRITETEQRAEIGVWFKFGNPVKQLRAWHNDLVKVDYHPDMSYAMAQATEGVSDTPYESRTSAEDILTILKDTKPKSMTKAVSEKVTAKKTLVTLALSAAGYLAYEEWVASDSDKEEKPENGIRLRENDVYISDAIAVGREIEASLGSSGSSSVSVGTFESSRSEDEVSE